MLYVIVKIGISAVIIGVASEIARRYPTWGGLVASLPLTSLLLFLWLWRDTGDPQRIAELSTSILWFVLASVPLFIALPLLLRSGLGFWPSMGIVIAGTLALYAVMFWAGPRLGMKL